MKIGKWLCSAAVLVIAAGLFFSCKPKETVPASFLSLAPKESFLYLDAKDLKAIRDTTKAYDFIVAARRLKLFDRLKAEIEAEKPLPADAREAAGKLEQIRRKASLWEIMGNEIALVVFPTEKGVKPALVILCRLPKGAGQEYLGYFEELVGTLIEGSETKISRSEFLDETLSSVAVARNDISLAPTWARVGDVLLIASRPEGARELVARLKGRGGKDSLPENPAFRKAMKGLDPRAMGVWYAQADGLLDWFLRVYKYQKGRVDDGIKAGGLPGGLESSEVKQIRYYLRLLTRAAKTVDLIGGNAGLSEDGWQEKTRIYLDPKEGSAALRAILRTPSRDYKVLSLLPAASAEVSAGFVQPEKIYRLFADYIVKNPAHGKAVARKWQAAEKEAGFDVTEDLLPVLGEEYGFALTSFAQSIGDPGSFILAWKAKEGAAVEQSLDKLVGVIKGKAAKQGGSYLNITEEEYEGAAMRVFYLPLPLLGLSPTLGVVDGYIVLASRKAGFQQVVDITKKKEKSIAQDEDFQRLAKRVDSRGMAISFTRVSAQIDGAVGMVRSISSLLGMTAAMSKPQTPEEEKELKKTQTRIALLDDVAQVLETLKAYKFCAGSWAYDGDCLESRQFTEVEPKRTK
ncbi:MAG: DUF3352 domain-containing protein [Candidatus Aureabacteria bacterium]|nr:DUF3352 domain-containing protein [Candidatus Auribacterota bacterium]